MSSLDRTKELEAEVGKLKAEIAKLKKEIPPKTAKIFNMCR